MSGAPLTRRHFLGLVGGVTVGALSGCAGESSSARPTVTPSPSSGALLPGGSGGTLTAGPVQLDLAGTVVTTWGYNGVVPGPEIRVRVGQPVRVRLANALTQDSSVHWHGISVPNAMDGVPGVTQPPVLPGGEFGYEFTPREAGSHMYHAHVGHQLDLGLYGPIVVESPDPEPLPYDREYTLMLDDWRDGLGIVAEPGAHSGGHSMFGSLGRSTPSPTPTEDLDDATPEDGGNPGIKLGARSYPLYLVNGRPAADPPTFEVRTGDRVRLRLMNIAADTGFLVAIAGHEMTITHTDGMPVEPVTVDAVRLGMGERYDVVVTARNPGAWQIAAVPEAKKGFGRAVLRYTDAPTAAAPPSDQRPTELGGRQAEYAQLRYTGSAERPTRAPDRVHDLTLSGTGRINGQRYPDADPLAVAAGELVRVTMRNEAALAHPMHLHGHAFWVGGAASGGPLKDTMLVPGNGGTGSFDFLADNAGVWMFHCHNHYHMENGMTRLFRYT